MPGFRHLRLEIGAVCHLALDAPPLNVLTIESLSELGEAVKRIRSAPGVRLVTLGSQSGRAFSAGVDVADHTPERIEEMLTVFTEAFLALYRLEMPVAALVRGFCLGGGFELVQACDIVLADETSRFGQPEIKLGVFAPVASVLLPRRIGANRAAEICLGGEPLSATEAYMAGIVHRVFPEKTFAASAEAYLERFMQLSSEALVSAKRAIRRADPGRLEDELHEMNRFYLQATRDSGDAREGVRAFMEKRKPRWSREGNSDVSE